jgi:DNA repair exonuclease SbcCD ATPase subunit
MYGVRLTLAHHTFCTAYGLRISIDDRRALKQMERDAEAFPRLTRELTAANKALTNFIAEHGHRPASALKHTNHSLEERKAAEQKLIHKQNALHAHIVQLEQRSRQLRLEIDRIPTLTDELTRLTEQKAADTDSRRLLDCTAAFLEQARESLSTSYMGSVQKHFVRHLSRLTGEQPNRIAVNSDLEVQLERMGSARPLSQFSTGQNDAVQLCMRLALADALFEDESCFMILDDPFVNLDDHHTARALALLKELSKNRQIIYLVCNSSRI